MNMTQATLVETRGLRPFKSSEEYLYAMKEDLAEWLNNLYPELFMNVINFLDRLDTGVNLCRHANNVRKYAEEHMVKRQGQGRDIHPIAITVLNLPCVKHLPGAKPGTFFARDNVSNFIAWCRKGLGIIDCLLFETDDLIMRKNEKHVILCLLEVARRGAKLGMPAPMLIQLEREIDREIAADKKKLGFSDVEFCNGDVEDDLSESDDDDAELGPKPQIVTNDLKSLDEMVRDLVARCTCPTQFPMIRVSEGKYRIGDTKVLIFVRVLRSHVMVRVGGGWDTLSHYLDKHDPCRCKSAHRSAASAKLVGMKSGGPQIDINHAQVHYDRSPPRTRRSSASSTGSGGGNPIQNTSYLTPSHTASRAANRNRSRSPTPRYDTLSPNKTSDSKYRSRSPTPRKNISRSTTPDPKSYSKNDRGRSVSKNREIIDTNGRGRSVSKNRDNEYKSNYSSRNKENNEHSRRSISRTRDDDNKKFIRNDSLNSYTNDRSYTNDYGNIRNGSLDYGSTRNSSIDYGNSRNNSLPYINNNNDSYSSLPYDINYGKTRSDSCYSDSYGKQRSDSCFSDSNNLDISKINEEITKLNKTYNNIDESNFLKKNSITEYQSGIDSSPAPKISDNFTTRTYEQVNITRPVTPVQVKSRIDSGVDTTPSIRISDNFNTSTTAATADSSDEGYRSLGVINTISKPVNTNGPVRSSSSLSSISTKSQRSRSTGGTPSSSTTPTPQTSPFRRNISTQRSVRNITTSPKINVDYNYNKNNTWNSKMAAGINGIGGGGVKKRPTIMNENTFVEQVADMMQQYAAMIPSPRKDKLSATSGMSNTRIPAPIHQRT